MKIAEKYSWLPVSEIADAVMESLARTPRLVVTAPPGAGKSTLLPLALLEGLSEGKILMLEPRRLAARQVASRMAEMLGEPVGRRVGYRVRFESRVSDMTRVEVITEGIMERMLIEDPTIEGVSVVIFDEFHERSLSSDTSLALALEAQQVIRPDLQIILMSATIDTTTLCQRLSAPSISSAGRMHDVGIIHCEDYDPRDCAAVVARAVVRAHREQEGDILVFLPGQAEIVRCAELLGDTLGTTRVLPLYGRLSPELQHQVLARPREGERRVVLATSIAETSLTIEGVRTVVDSGLCRTPVFDPSSGLTRLATITVSLDMANQRTGRAGRLSRGVCYRLWSKAAEHRMKDSREPEIMSADLAPMVLGIAAWGESNPRRLPWITSPPEGHVSVARSLLESLGAVSGDGSVTSLGRRLSQMPCHPRIARMLTCASSDALRATACDIAALLEEKDPLNDENDADITTRIAILRQQRARRGGRWQRVADVAAQYRRLAKVEADNSSVESEDVGRLIATAYPERVAKRCGDGRYRLASGEYVTLGEDDALSRHDLLAVASAARGISLAAPISADDVASMGRWVDNVSWDSRAGRVVVGSELRVGALVLDTRQAGGDYRQLVVDAIVGAAPKDGLSMFDFNDDVVKLQLRIATVAGWHPDLELPRVDTESILATCAEWLPMYIGKATTAQELRKIDMCAVIWGIVGYDGQCAVERLAPSTVRLPGGRNARVDYRRGAEVPVVKARLQDCFGLMETPRLDDGRRPVLMELLSPGFKPVQLTQDMEGFWRTTYYEVRKELRRRYPKHRWPDKPNSM